MGFKKTEKGNVIYEFDFTPTKLVPLKKDECGYSSCYAVEGAGGERAPVAFVFQGERHGNYALVFGFITPETAKGLGVKTDICVCSNAPLLATFVRFFKDCEPEESTFDPWSTNKLATEGRTFDILPLDEAKRYLDLEKVPLQGYDVLWERTM